MGCLYNPQLYGQNQKTTRPYNWILIHLKDGKSAVIVEVNSTKDNLEIVNWHYLRDETLSQKEKQAAKEGGLILTLSEDNAAGTAANDDLFSKRKDTNNSENPQPTIDNRYSIPIEIANNEAELASVSQDALQKSGERIVGEIVTEIAKESTEVVTDKAEMQRVLNEEVEKVQKDAIEATNNTFNKQLDGLNEDNANSVRLELGMPSAVLLSSGIANKPMLLYGNKVIKKAKKHGFSPKDLKDLPKAVQSPIAVFDGSKQGSFAILTEIKIDGKNMLVSLTLSREGNVDLNIITSAYGKNTPSVINWINSGKLRYAGKQKALDYISTSAPIADATNNQEPYNSAAKVVENFENPKISADILQKMTVWHGSPYAFDAFDHSKVGTGEGAQAHGWGTYVVKDEETGKRYAETLGKGGCRASVVCREGKEYARENVGCHKAMACQQQRV